MIPEWITLSTTAGTGTTTVAVSANSYSELVERSSSLTVRSGDRSAVVTVNQKPNYTLTLSPDYYAFPARGGSFVLNITTQDSWNILRYDSWMTLSQTRGTGNAQVTVTASYNNYGQNRNGWIGVFNSSTSGKVDVFQVYSSSAFTGSITPSAITAPITQSTTAISVTCDGSWYLECDDFIGLSVTSGQSGTNIPITVTILPNSSSTRTGGIRLKSVESHELLDEAIVTQQGSFAPSISPSSHTFTDEGGEFVITVSSPYEWDFTWDGDWLLPYREGNTIVVVALQNRGSARTGSVTVTTNGQQLTCEIDQLEVVPYIILTPPAVLSETTGGTITVETESNIVWSAVTSDNWLSVSPTTGTDNTTITITIGSNSGSPRVGIIDFYFSGSVLNTLYVMEKGTVNYNQPLTIQMLESGTLVFENPSVQTTQGNSISYSFDNATWSSFTLSNTSNVIRDLTYEIPVNSGDTVYVKGTTHMGILNSGNPIRIHSTAKHIAYANALSLHKQDNYSFRTSMSYGELKELFLNDVGLLSSSQMLFGFVSTPSEYGFDGMFDGCTNMFFPPVNLPSKTYFASYEFMFAGCSKLLTTPVMPDGATAYTDCFYHMFTDCESLTGVPYSLYATTLETRCYQNMFAGCKSLKTAPLLPATTLASGCYSGMFDGCESLENAPALSALTMTEGCYSYMFRGCKALTSAPILPADTLYYYCYAYMFDGCENLNFVKCLYGGSITDYRYTEGWMNGVSPTGTFRKASSATWPTNSGGIDYGVPSGWDVYNA